MGGWSQSKTMIYVDGKLSEEEVFVDSIALKNYVELTKIRWINEGFLFSGLDSLSVSGKTPKVYLHKGNASDLSIAGIKGKKVEKSLTKLSKRYSNSGYPFAQLRVDSITYKDNFLRGLVKVEEGPLIRYDSAFFYQNPKTNHSYIYQLLAIMPGELFSERSYATIADKIQRSPFLSLQRATDLSFSSEKAKIYLDLKEQTTNSFQGVLGLQQNPSGGSRVVGSLDLEVQNLFRSGHEFHFNWESFAANSQRLNLYYKHAFPFKAKFSPSFVFTLLKQDTTFVTRTTGIGVNTFIGSSVNLSLDYEATSGSLIASEAETVGGMNLADYRQNL